MCVPWYLRYPGRSMKTMFWLSILSLRFLQADVTAGEMLYKAATLGNLATIETLLSAGVNPDLPDRYGQTPLCFAMRAGQTQVVKLLLAYHANPNAPLNRQSRETPLQFAVRSANLPMVSILIAGGADVNAKGPGGSTALHFAVADVHLDMIRLLIEKGADVNCRDGEGTSPLDEAVWDGSLDAAAVLLAHGARLNESHTKTGATPINEASYRGNASVVEYLLQFHPDLGIPDKRGYSPLDNAIRMAKEDSALLLLQAEVKGREAPQDLGKAMDAAIRKDESLLVDSLLQHGVPLGGTLPSGYTPLDAAAFVGATKVARLLLENGADPNIAGPDGTTALEDASLKGSVSIVSVLLDHGALVNHLNRSSGTTALYAAAAFGRGEVVKLLLDRGADPRLCGNNHKSPYQAALENGYNELATEIKVHGGANQCQP
jgi:ankyrin repeat protein